MQLLAAKEHMMVKRGGGNKHGHHGQWWRWSDLQGLFFIRTTAEWVNGVWWRWRTLFLPPLHPFRLKRYSRKQSSRWKGALPQQLSGRVQAEPTKASGSHFPDKDGLAWGQWGQEDQTSLLWIPAYRWFRIGTTRSERLTPLLFHPTAVTGQENWVRS